PLYQNAITQGFMIWAGWFPVALAVLGTLVALVAPFRRPQVEVTEAAPPPAPVPVWTPPPPMPTYTTPTAYGVSPPPGRIPGSVGAATPYDRTVANPSPYATQPGPQAPYNAPTARAYGGLEPPLPPRDPYNPYPPDSATRGFTPTTRDVGAAPSTDVLSAGYQTDTNRDAPLYRSGAGKIDTDSLFVPTPTSDSDEPEPPSSEGPESLRPSADWLATSTGSASSQSAISDAEDVAEPQPRVPDDAQVAEPEEPEPTGVMAASESGDMAETSEVSEASEAHESGESGESGETGETGEAPEPEVVSTTYTPTEMTCSNCGAPVLSDAKFCTECGTRVVHA
ncbi:MAG TPA: zinc-ribbon domain-containing protein, partial [Chloroflexia bacterium]